jgi:hypothetical protein
MRNHYNNKCRSFIPLKYPLFYIIICEHTDEFAPSWYKFKNSFVVDKGLLDLQPFKNSHFYFFTIVESATSPSVASGAQTNGSPTE